MLQFYLIFDSRDCCWMSWRDFQKAIFLRIVSLKARYMTNDDDDELFLCYGWPTKGI